MLLVAAAVLAGCDGRDTRDRPPASGAGTVPGAAGEPEPEAPAAPNAPVRLIGVATDNYKASFNEDPEAPELRTWLSIRELEVAGVRWRLPAQVTAAEQASFGESVALEPVAGGPASANVTVEPGTGPIATLQMRMGPQEGRWGPLLLISSREALTRAPATARLIVTIASGPRRSRHALALTYVRDPELTAAPEDSLEHNGPGGRWQVAGTATVTNVEAGLE